MSSPLSRFYLDRRKFLIHPSILHPASCAQSCLIEFVSLDSLWQLSRAISVAAKVVVFLTEFYYCHRFKKNRQMKEVRYSFISHCTDLTSFFLITCQFHVFHLTSFFVKTYTVTTAAPARALFATMCNFFLSRLTN